MYWLGFDFLKCVDLNWTHHWLELILPFTEPSDWKNQSSGNLKSQINHRNATYKRWEERQIKLQAASCHSIWYESILDVITGRRANWRLARGSAGPSAHTFSPHTGSQIEYRLRFLFTRQSIQISLSRIPISNQISDYLRMHSFIFCTFHHYFVWSQPFHQQTIKTEQIKV